VAELQARQQLADRAFVQRHAKLGDN